MSSTTVSSIFGSKKRRPGVTESATSQEVKRAYRKQMNEHHPDKLAAKGLPPEMMEIANQKAQELQAAYDMIRKEKGFK